MADALVYVYWALFVASTAYSYEQSRKARRRAEAASEAAKGYDLPVEGESSPVFAIYGRNLVGGIRVYHNTSSDFVANNEAHANRQIFTTTIPGYYEIQFTDAPGSTAEFPNIVQTEVYVAAASSFTSSIAGDKNEFLYVQQVIGFGKIDGVYGIDIDGKDFTHPDYQFGVRIDVERAGGAASPMMTAQFGVRSTALFTHTAYASAVYRINRDDPQFGGSVPATQFYVKGLWIAPIELSMGVYSLGTPRYSNNPAECLLDYLMNPVYGRGLSLNSIDLKTFYDAAIICNTTVQSGASCAGKIWGATTTRDLPLYECNLLIDSSKSVRDNVEEILATMADADLVWSGGVYKLLLQYPANEAAIIVAGTITDDDIMRDSISITYPSASERKNFCNIQFRNEAQDFKNDTASWPPRFSVLHNALLAEDGSVPLEMNLTMSGIVDVHHAIAKAEEMVRGSRSNVSYQFKTHLNGILYEPGDIVLVNSNVASIFNEYLKIKEIKFNSDNTASIKASKFDYTTLAWNAKDDEVVVPRNNYNFLVSPPTGVTYTSAGTVYGYTSGKLTFTPPADKTVISEYIVYAASSRGFDLPGATLVWNELGRTIEPEFQIAGLESAVYVFAVVGVTPQGRRSARALSASVEILKESIAGADGEAGTSAITITVYKQAVDRPDRPIEGNYTFVGDVFVPPTGWSRSQPDSSLIPTWASSCLFVTSTPAAPISGPPT